MTLDSSAGAISIGGDAVAQAINVGTGAAARTITVGNTTGATALVVNSGTGSTTVNGGLRVTPATAGAITGATVLTAADSGGVFSVSQAAAYDIDLPAAAIGRRFQFYLTSPGANNVTITVLAAASTFVGTIGNDVTSVIPATGSTLTFATGAAALGDNIEIIGISASLYLVRAFTSAAGGITVA